MKSVQDEWGIMPCGSRSSQCPMAFRIYPYLLNTAIGQPSGLLVRDYEFLYPFWPYDTWCWSWNTSTVIASGCHAVAAATVSNTVSNAVIYATGRIQWDAQTMPLAPPSTSEHWCLSTATTTSRSIWPVDASRRLSLFFRDGLSLTLTIALASFQGRSGGVPGTRAVLPGVP